MPFLLAGVALAGLLWIHASTVRSALLGQQSGLINVGALAPLAAAWLIWTRRERLRRAAVRAWWPGLLGVAAASVAWALGDLIDFNILRQAALVALLLAMSSAILGLRQARELAPPLLFLLFAVNLFFPLVPFLMQATAWLGVAALRLSGLPAELQGLAVVLPKVRWQIVEGCCGIDYLLIYVMSAALFASIAMHSPMRRLLFVVAAVPAALLANVLRAWSIVLAVYERGGADVEHDIYGWAAFAIVYLAFLALGYRLSEAAPEDAPTRTQASATPGSVGACALAALAALAIAAVAPAALAESQGLGRGADVFDGCRVLDRADVVREGRDVVRVRSQCSGPTGIRQLPEIAKKSLLAAAPGALPVGGQRRMEATGDGAAIDAATLTGLDTLPVFRVTYWYDIDGRATADRVELKWRLALARLQGREARAAVVTELERLNHGG
jgi:exosortase